MLSGGKDRAEWCMARRGEKSGKSVQSWQRVDESGKRRLGFSSERKRAAQVLNAGSVTRFAGIRRAPAFRFSAFALAPG
jgi:hypothetical protein